VYTLQEILDSPVIYVPLTKFQCGPTSDGAAAAAIVYQRFLDARPHLKGQTILTAGQAFHTDPLNVYSGSVIHLIGHDMTLRPAHQARSEPGV
jgi:sterol carrier protein 2